MKRVPGIVLLLCIPILARAQPSDFSQDSAYANLKVIAGEIGPRPMGSPAEQRALAFAVSRFAAYGCQESYVMPISVVSASIYSGGNGTNTHTGVAVGIRKGRTGRIIVIGGHMDSSGPEIPGANDDGSGAASVIELARVLCRRDNESTMVFCCWGGEEFGLVGSDYFVSHFAQIDSVVLMLQIDMADGSGNLEADPDGGYQVSAPAWLVEATFDIFYDDLHYSGLVYPTRQATVNSSTSGLSGSDHMSFLAKGIPAIDFTSDVSYPIHQPLDNLQNFNPAGLMRSGELVLKLAERFDAGVPSHDTEKYWLTVIGTRPFFVSYPLLWTFIVLSLSISVITLLTIRRRRPVIDPASRVRWSGLKLLLFTLLIQTFICCSESIVGLVSGYRFPWVNNTCGFVILAAVSGLIGVWLSLALARRLPLSTDPYTYYLRVFVILVIVTLALSAANPELGSYGAAALLFIALAMLLRVPLLKLILLLPPPFVLLGLLYFEDISIVQRGLAFAVLDSWWPRIVYNGLFVLFFTGLTLPFAFAFAAVYRDAGVDLLWLKKFRTRGSLLVTAGAAVVMVAYLALQPVYDRLWEKRVSIREQFGPAADSSSISLVSAEYLSGLRVSYDSADSVLRDRVCRFDVRPFPRPVNRWCAIEEADVPAKEHGGTDTLRTLNHMVAIHSRIRPLSVRLSYASKGPITISSPWAIGKAGNSIFWYSFPDTILVVPVTFAVRDSQQIYETAEVVYDTLIYPVSVEEEYTYAIRRTTITRTDTIGVP